jgi:hypothetical protein
VGLRELSDDTEKISRAPAYTAYIQETLGKKKLRQGGTLGDFICLANMRLYIKKKQKKQKRKIRTKSKNELNRGESNQNEPNRSESNRIKYER